MNWLRSHPSDASKASRRQTPRVPLESVRVIACERERLAIENVFDVFPAVAECKEHMYRAGIFPLSREDPDDRLIREDPARLCRYAASTANSSREVY